MPFREENKRKKTIVAILVILILVVMLIVRDCRELSKQPAEHAKAYAELSEAINNESAALCSSRVKNSDLAWKRITNAKSVLYSSTATTKELLKAKSSLLGKDSTRKNLDSEYLEGQSMANDRGGINE